VPFLIISTTQQLCQLWLLCFLEQATDDDAFLRHLL
jgi:hypothetical protein